MDACKGGVGDVRGDACKGLVRFGVLRNQRLFDGVRTVLLSLIREVWGVCWFDQVANHTAGQNSYIGFYSRPAEWTN